MSSTRLCIPLLFVTGIIITFAVVTPLVDAMENNERTVIAEVNGEPIYLEELYEAWESMPEAYRKQFPRGFRDLLEQWIRQYLLEQAARESGLHKEPCVERKIEHLTRQVLVQEFIDREVMEKVEVSEEKIESEYLANPSLYTEAARVEAWHIMVESEEDADEAMHRLRQGESFDEVARQMSVAPDASRGGEMGMVRRGDLSQGMEEVVFGLSEGDISPVTRSEYGYHIFMLERHEEPRLKDLDEVRDEIIARLSSRLKQEIFEKLVEDLKTMAEIAIIEDNIPSELLHDGGD